LNLIQHGSTNENIKRLLEDHIYINPAIIPRLRRGMIP
jgi:hypothetical protein